MTIVWSIAGSDSGGGAGIQADLAAYSDFNTHGCTAITALTAQNSVGVQAVNYVGSLVLNSQINAIKYDLPAKAIKLGLLGTQDNLKVVSAFLHEYKGHVIVDPVFCATTGARLADDELAALYQRYIFPYVTLLTPNVSETKLFTGINLTHEEDYLAAARKLLAMGCQAVLIKSGDATWDPLLSSDFYADHKQHFWINHYRIDTRHTHGTGCTLSSAITACLALGYNLQESIILAKTYIQAGLKVSVGLGKGPGPVVRTGFPNNSLNFPWISQKPQDLHLAFPPCEQPLGFYPLVNNLEDLAFCIDYGFSTVQLRIKNHEENYLRKTISSAVNMARNTKTQLFINDYWQLAIEAHAYGVHLGQDDLLTADIRTIHQAGLRLGLSSNCLYSLSKAYAYNPSYLAAGPVFPTQSKPDAKPPIGIDKLTVMKNLSPKPLCAIGGIEYDEFQSILKMGCQGVAFISALNAFKKHDVPIF